MIDLIIRNGNIVTHNNERLADIAIKNGKIFKIGKLTNLKSKKNIDVRGLHVLPGAFDTQVHFREPGNTKKENLKTGSLAAVAGGITSVFDMPNNKPSITTKKLFLKKLQTAKKRMHCNYAFYFGAEKDNIKEIKKVEKVKGCCGVKVFVGSSTGTLLVSNHNDIEKIMRSTNKMISFHSENEDMLITRKKYAKKGMPLSHQVWRNVDTALSSTRKLIRSAYRSKKKIHVLHITTAEEIKLLLRNRKYVSFEVTPQHLTLASPDCYKKLGTYAQMNPPIRGTRHRNVLRKTLKKGQIDIVGSDHAPHLKSEKNKIYPNSPSGMPGVQTLLPILLNEVTKKTISLNEVVKLTSFNPKKIFKIKNKGLIKVGYDADLTIVDMNKTKKVLNKDMKTKCGWTPFNGMKLKGWPVGTIINGKLAFWKNKINKTVFGNPISFN
jgi:dihydroorotase